MTSTATAGAVPRSHSDQYLHTQPQASAFASGPAASAQSHSTADSLHMAAADDYRHALARSHAHGMHHAQEREARVLGGLGIGAGAGAGTGASGVGAGAGAGRGWKGDEGGMGGEGSRAGAVAGNSRPPMEESLPSFLARMGELPLSASASSTPALSAAGSGVGAGSGSGSGSGSRSGSGAGSNVPGVEVDPEHRLAKLHSTFAARSFPPPSAHSTPSVPNGSAASTTTPTIGQSRTESSPSLASHPGQQPHSRGYAQSSTSASSTSPIASTLGGHAEGASSTQGTGPASSPLAHMQMSMQQSQARAGARVGNDMGGVGYSVSGGQGGSDPSGSRAGTGAGGVHGTRNGHGGEDRGQESEQGRDIGQRNQITLPPISSSFAAPPFPGSARLPEPTGSGPSSSNTLSAYLNPFSYSSDAGPSSHAHSQSQHQQQHQQPLFPSYDLSTSFRSPFSGSLSNFFPPAPADTGRGWAAEGAGAGGGAGRLMSDDQRAQTGQVRKTSSAGGGSSSTSPADAAATAGQQGSAAAAGSASAAAAAKAEQAKTGRAGNKRKQKFTRTRTGCLCCRSRRIKCDEGRPTCKRCIIAKRVCEYPEMLPDSRGSSMEPLGEGEILGASGLAEGDALKRLKGDGGDTMSPSFFQDSVLGLDNVFATQTGMDAQQTGILGSADFNFDESYIAGYDTGSALANTLSSANTVPGTTTVGMVDIAGQPVAEGQVYDPTGTPMLATPNFLLPWFPTTEERSLILHYCANAADLMMAIPSGLNPMLAINLPLALHAPRGMSAATDALRVALLGIGAIHQAFLLARSGISTAQTASMFQYAASLRDTGKDMVRRAMAVPGGAQSDATLGAATSLMLIDIFFGGGSWRDNFELARQMITSRGGPAKMLQSSLPTPLADGVTVSAARLNLEIFAIYETMGCLTTGEEPFLLSDQWENWWFESSRSTYEEHSVEKQFGMSRTMVHLFSRLTRLLARTRGSKTKIVITEHEPFVPPGSDPGVLAIALAAAQGQGQDPLVREARKLNADVDAWIESLQIASLEHERVQVGNRAYAHTMKILLLRNVFKVARIDMRVQNAANEVLRHCSTSTALLGMSIDLTWPAIIAACCVDHSSRQWVLTLLEGFKAQCCFDIDTAARIIQEVWRRVDRGDERDDWRDVCDDLGLQVL